MDSIYAKVIKDNMTPNRKQKFVDSERCHDLLVKNFKPKYSDKNGMSYDEWKNKIKEKFLEVIGYDVIKENACPLNFEIEWEEDKEDHRLIRFTIESEVGEIVPCYLLIPKTGKKKYPVAITMQGHSTGFHNSIGEPKYEVDFPGVGRVNFAEQAVKNGYIGLAIEQRGMGERKAYTDSRSNDINCRWTYRVALALGRTLIGERIWDIQRVIDALVNFPECDMDKIFITGNSGGGTISYYATCLDDRLKFCAPSCAFCPYADSILALAHCGCNYLPGSYRYFEMQDLACLIAPKNLILIAGSKDDIFPIEGVRKGFEKVKEIYAENGVLENCKLVETPKDHWWCKDIVWKEINEVCKKLGWN